MGKTKEYTNGEVTIVWKPEKCIHAGVCVKMLPDVYHPKEKPWVKPENTSTEKIIEQVSKCPSGALTYKLNESNQNTMQEETNETQVEVIGGGPLMVYGACRVKDEKGNIDFKEKVTAFCRCGASTNKPYCDGSHKGIEFDK